MTNTDLDLLEENLELTSDTDSKIHPWRICPIGTHLVRTHDLHIPPSREHLSQLNLDSTHNQKI